MGILNHKCDSCEKIVDVLFPIAILDETPTGEQMVQKWYCVECKDTLEEEAGDVETDDTDEEDDNDKDDEDTTRKFTCGCVYDRLIAIDHLWKEYMVCINHYQHKKRNYECGCITELIEEEEDIWHFIEECKEHE